MLTVGNAQGEYMPRIDTVARYRIASRALPPRSTLARMAESPRFTRIEPLWKPLGYESTRHGRRYWVEVKGHRRRCKTGDLYGLAFLLEIYPDREHWRRQFPGHGRRVDTSAALRYLIGACERAGEYVPPVDVDSTPV